MNKEKTIIQPFSQYAIIDLPIELCIGRAIDPYDNPPFADTQQINLYKLSTPIRIMDIGYYKDMDIMKSNNQILAGMVLLLLIVVTIGMKFGGNMVGNLIFRQKRSRSLRSAFTLAAPRGEFSIVIIKVGVDVGAVSAFLFPLIGIISIITAFISPFLMKTGDKIIPILDSKKNV